VPNENVSLSLLICSDKEIQQFNYKYRHIDSPTDVLSFGLEEKIPDFNERYLGDIIVSYETANKQSSLMEHSVITEIKILAIHGLLHLIGYDHDTKAKKEKMWNKQIEILNFIGIKATFFSGEND
jgi:probable rRNA maturation factor